MLFTGDTVMEPGATIAVSGRNLERSEQKHVAK
jgi:hypothetical protein